MKCAIVFDLHPSVMDRINQSGGGNERLELTLSRDCQDPTRMVRAQVVSQSIWYPALFYIVSDRLPMAEPILLAQTGDYRPTPEEIKVFTEQRKDDTGSRNPVTARLSMRFRSLQPMAIQNVMDSCAAIARKADKTASTFWRFVDAAVFDDDGNPLPVK